MLGNPSGVFPKDLEPMLSLPGCKVLWTSYSSDMQIFLNSRAGLVRREIAMCE